MKVVENGEASLFSDMTVGMNIHVLMRPDEAAFKRIMNRLGNHGFSIE